MTFEHKGVVCAALCFATACGSSDEREPGGAEVPRVTPGDAAPPGEQPIESLDCNDPDVLCYEFGPIEVAPGSEWQGFQAMPVGFADERAIVRIEIEQTGSMSHHFIIAPWSAATPPPLEGPYDLFTNEGLQFVGDALGNIVAGSIYEYVNIDTGSYIGVAVPANGYLINNGHYLNTAAVTAVGHTAVRMKLVPVDQVQFLAIEAQPGVTDFSVPPGTQQTVGTTWEPPSDVAVLLMTSHMHQHGRLFEAWSVIDGVEQKIYSTTEYDAPPLEIWSSQTEPPVVLRAGRGDHLRFACTLDNHDLDVPLVFGPSAYTNEMCILPLYYTDEPDALLALLADGSEESSFGWEYVPYGEQ